MAASGAPARPLTTADAVAEALRGRRVDVRGYVFEGALLLTLLVSLGIVVTLLATISAEGSGVLLERGPSFVLNPTSSNPEIAGVGQGIVGSLVLMVFVAVIAFPVGIGAAVYLEEYAADTRLTRFISTNIRNLAGVPAIVYGLLGLAIFVVWLAPLTGGRSIVSGGLTLAVLVLPIVIITTAEALRAVPGSLREAAFGVGATRWQVVRSHVLPYTAPGIFTGTVLSLARAFGETAPLILVGAVLGGFSSSPDSVGEWLHDRYTALPTIVFNWSRNPQPEFRELTAAAIMVLLVVLLAVNATAIVLRNRYDTRW